MQADKELFYSLINKKLAGEATPGELQKLEDLLRKHPGWHYILENLTSLWQLPPQAPSTEAAAAFEKHLQRMQTKEAEKDAFANPQDEPPAPYKMFKNPFALAAAAVFIVAVVAVAMYLPYNAKGKTNMVSNEVHARPGAKTKVDLPDGSVVWLNSGSRLSYDAGFGRELRKVTLVGEGYFDVVTNPQKPFVVHTAALDIKVLGTIFNIKAYPNEAAEASLIEGSIQATALERPQEVIVLKPNEKLVIPFAPAAGQNENTTDRTTEKEPIMILQHVAYQAEKDSMPIETAWVQNKLVFRDEAFEDLARRIERWYGVRIQFKDEAVKELRFTGTFSRESLQQVLKALKITGRFQYEIENDAVFISSH